MSFDFSIPEKKNTKEKPIKSTITLDAKVIFELTDKLENLEKKYAELEKLISPIQRKGTAEFLKFIREKFNIPNLSRADMRDTKKLTMIDNYDDKKALSQMIRFHGNFDTMLTWVYEFIESK